MLIAFVLNNVLFQHILSVEEYSDIMYTIILMLIYQYSMSLFYNIYIYIYSAKLLIVQQYTIITSVIT